MEKKHEWTFEEEKKLKSLWNKESMHKLIEYFKTSKKTIEEKAKELGLPAYKSNRWTKEEEELLREYSKKYLTKTIAKKLERSIDAVNTKAKKLGITLTSRRSVWKKWQIKYLCENVNKKSLRQIGIEIGINEYQILKKIKELGIEYDSDRWTVEEEDLLKDLSTTVYIKELAKLFNRTEAAVTSKARKMGLDYITTKHEFKEEEKNYIKDNWGIIPLNEMARKLKVSRMMVSKQGELMNLPPLGNNPYKKWTLTEIEKLKELSKTKTIEQIAKYFHTTKEAISSIACKEEITLIDGKIIWSKEDKKQLEDLAKTKNVVQIADIMNRTPSSIRIQAKRQNITLIPQPINKGRNWTLEELELLEQLVMVDKKTPKEIAKIFGRSEDAVIIKINRQGLKIQTNKKRFWTEAEEALLQELWGEKSMESIAKKLNRSVSSVKNKANTLGLGSYLNNNYNGLTISEISKIFNISESVIEVSWISLGLKCERQKVTKSTKYRYVKIKDLWKFLEANQNIWDSRNLEKNILGKEPAWLEEKRKKDIIENPNYGSLYITKQQLINAKKYFLEEEEKVKVLKK